MPCFPSHKNNAPKIVQFNIFQKKLPFNLQDISAVNGLITFYIDIKTTEHAKKGTMFQGKIEYFWGK